MRFLSLIAIFAVSLIFPSMITAADPDTISSSSSSPAAASAPSSKCIAGASSSLAPSPTRASNLYEARFNTNQIYNDQSVKYPDNVDLHWSITDSDSKDSDNSVQSFLVRIAHEGQMVHAHAISVHQDGLFLTPGQRIRYWHSYSINGELCNTEAESYVAKPEEEISNVASPATPQQDRVDPVSANHRTENINNNNANSEEEVELTESSDASSDFNSQQVTPTIPPSPATPTTPSSPATPTTPTAPVTPQQPTYPEPPATCANDEYFCQIYKNCYPCVANPNQPLCEQCNKLFACADVNCRQKEACTLCKTYWNAYTNPAMPAGPFVCSVVRGQC